MYTMYKNQNMDFLNLLRHFFRTSMCVRSGFSAYTVYATSALWANDSTRENIMLAYSEI
jgi:hypothetical protein